MALLIIIGNYVAIEEIS